MSPSRAVSASPRRRRRSDPGRDGEAPVAAAAPSRGRRKAKATPPPGASPDDPPPGAPPGAPVETGVGAQPGAADADAAARGPGLGARLRAALSAARRSAAKTLRDAWIERRTPPLARPAPALAAIALVCALAAAAALAAGVAGERLARAWTAEFGQAATLVALGPPEAAARDFAAALEVLRTTPGIAAARPLEAPERRALLAPWLAPGQAAPAEPPPMATLTMQGAGPDRAALALRLAAEAPGAVYDDHSAWRGPLIAAATSARAIGWGAAGLAMTLGAALCALFAGAWTAAARPEQRLLRRLGAEPRRLRRAWAGRAGARVFLFAALGAGLAAALLAAPDLLDLPAARAPITPSGPDWLALAAPPPALALAAWLGARLALRPALRGAPGDAAPRPLRGAGSQP